MMLCFVCCYKPTPLPALSTYAQSAGHGIQPQAPLPAVSPAAQQLQQGAQAAAVSAAAPPVVPAGGVPAGAVPTSPAQSLAANLSSQVR